MRVLVVSDSHGITRDLEVLLARYRDAVDMICHCGDSEIMRIDTMWHLVDGVVKGNMDFDRSYVTELCLNHDRFKLFMTHGHLYRVNFTREELANAAKLHACQVALYGHTHMLAHEMINGVLCINPGSFKQSRGPITERTYAILDVSYPIVTIHYYTHEHVLLDQLSATYTIGE